MTSLHKRHLVQSWSVTVAGAGLFWLLSSVSMALAQSVPSPATRQPGVPEGRHLIETIRIWKMTEALNLDEDQAARLFPKLSQLEASRREFHKRQRLLRDELAALLKQRPVRDEEIKARLDQMDRAEAEFRTREQTMKGGLRSVLNPEQQARLALFEDRFETEMRRVIQDLRQHRRVLPPGPSQGVQAPGSIDRPSIPTEDEPPRR